LGKFAGEGLADAARGAGKEDYLAVDAHSLSFPGAGKP
jgi:hypothetical protein